MRLLRSGRLCLREPPAMVSWNLRLTRAVAKSGSSPSFAGRPRVAPMAEKPFTLDAPQYDQSTWAGRTKHFFTVTNPVFLFTRHVPRVRPQPLPRLPPCRLALRDVRNPVTAMRSWPAQKTSCGASRTVRPACRACCLVCMGVQACKPARECLCCDGAACMSGCCTLVRPQRDGCPRARPTRSCGGHAPSAMPCSIRTRRCVASAHAHVRRPGGLSWS